MTLVDYDETVAKYFLSLFENTVFGYQERQLWGAATEQKDVTVKLPLIGINRVSSVLNLSTLRNNPRIQRGYFFGDTNSTMREIPVNLRYQLDFYADSRRVCEELWREVIRYMLDFPYMDVSSIVDEKAYKHRFPILIEDSPVDNTNVLNFIEKGNLYRVTQDFVLGQCVLLFEKKPEGEGLIKHIPIKQVVLERSLGTDTYDIRGV